MATLFIAWLACVAAQSPVAAAGPALSVDATMDRHAISPDIYGMNFADSALAQELHLPVNRRGGNATSRYNYQNNITNHAQDYFYENIPDDESADQFIDADRAHGTRSIITMPLIGDVAKSSSPVHPYACGFSVPKYGAQESTDPFQSDCGNGLAPDGVTPIAGNDPADTSIPAPPSFDQGWVNHLIGRYGTAASGGVQLYDLDNEPFLWHDTHRDVHPVPEGYDSFTATSTQYAAAIKQADPGAQALGPSDWGYLAYYDAPSPTDNRASHGNIPFAAWYLQQMKAYEDMHHVRILDYFDEHYYPQSDTNGLCGGDIAGAIDSTRSLWDPTYTDPSWIGATIQAIPQFHAWVDSNYPGTKIAISEYAWGCVNTIGGALAEADVLGIFGRERIDLAALWTAPQQTDAITNAFRIYRNYDGQGSMFGDTAVRATSTNQGQLAIYAAQRGSDNALTLAIINKSTANLQSTLSLSGYAPATSAQVYRYSGAHPSGITHDANIAVGASGFTGTFPADSITLVVLSPGANPSPLPVPRPSAPPQGPPPMALPSPRTMAPVQGSPAPLPGSR